MTLIAAFKTREVPILLGDFLLTAGYNPSAASYIPSGLRKKVHLISSNFVVAWTGKSIAAIPVLKDLFEKFNGHCVSYEQIEQFLINYPVQENLGNYSVHLIGWVIDHTSHCFLWNSQYPKELFLEPFHYDGTGDKTIEKNVRDKLEAKLLSTNDPNGGVVPNVGRAILDSLGMACNLISDEVLAGNNQRMGFGHAYEILYFDEGAFKYVDNVLYMTWDFHFDDNRMNQTGELNVQGTLYNVYKYRNFSNYAVVETIDIKNNYEEFHTITPMYEERRGAVDSIIQIAYTELKSYPYACNYYCVYVRFLSTDNPPLISIFIAEAGQLGNTPFNILDNNGKALFGVDVKDLHQRYLLQKAQQKGQG